MAKYERITRYIEPFEDASSEAELRRIYQAFIEACYEPDVLDPDYFETLERHGLSCGRHLNADVESLDVDAAVAAVVLLDRSVRGMYDAGPDAKPPLLRAIEEGYGLRLLRRIAELDGTWRRPNVVTFYHEYDKHGFLSNWYEAPFEFAGLTFPTTEHWMMWQKARLFGDDRTAKAILSTRDLDEVKHLGRQVRPYADASWHEVRVPVMRVGLRHKFAQNARLLNDLLSTGTAVLAEAAPNDAVWGIGIGAGDRRASDPAEWHGQNLLGRLLMEVRSELRVVSLCGMGAGAWTLDGLMRSQIWGMSLLELARMPSTRPAAMMYATFAAEHDPHLRGARDALRRVRASIGDIDESMRANMGGGLPIAGWRELVDELAMRVLLDGHEVRVSSSEAGEEPPSRVSVPRHVGGDGREHGQALAAPPSPGDRKGCHRPFPDAHDEGVPRESLEDVLWGRLHRGDADGAERMLDGGDRSFLASLADGGGHAGELASLTLNADADTFVNALGDDTDLARMCRESDDTRRVVLLSLHVGVALGDAACANYLGALYYMGGVVGRDYARAKELYELADSKGLVQGMINLGYVYEYGRVGEPDYMRAYTQYAKAAAIAGHFEALYKLGDMYARGRLGKPDLRVALALYDRSLSEAEGLVAQAQPAFRIAELFSDSGNANAGIPYDPMGALGLYQLAERGLRIDIAHGQTYYRDRLQKAIEGQERMRELLDAPGFWDQEGRTE